MGFGLNALKTLLSYLRHIVEQGITVTIQFSETGERKFKVKPDGFRPSWIVIHHSLSADGNVRNWDAIKKYHMSYRHNGKIITRELYELKKAQGEDGLEIPFRDVGYHFCIENVNGNLEVLPGRLIGESGAHAPGFNGNSVAICLIGNYDNEPPSVDRLSLVASLCRQLQLEYKIPRDQVIGHRETYGKPGAPPLPAQKTCPGKLFDLDKLRAVLRD